MTRHLIFLIAATSAATACAQSAINRGEAAAPPEACKDDTLASFIGQKASPDLGARMLEASGARSLRWVPPRSAVTMDFRPDRLTVSYDDDMVITRASCG